MSGHKRMLLDVPRAPTSAERDLLSRLLSLDFPGRRELLAQLASAKVAVICPICPSIEFDIARTSPRAPVANGIPVEAEVERSNRGATHLLLHVADGYLSQLEVYADAEPTPHELPDPSELAIIVRR